MAGEESCAPEIVIPLDREGWHDIAVGLFNGFWRPYSDHRLWVRLSSDREWTVLVLRRPSDLPWGVPADDDDLGPRITSVPFRTADLTGESLHIRQSWQLIVGDGCLAGNRGTEAYVFYVALTGLTEEERARVQADLGRVDTRNLFAYNDSWSPHYDRGRVLPGEAEEATIRSQLGRYRDSDVSRLYWEGALGDICHYFSEVGRMWDRRFFPRNDLPRQADRMLIESWTEYVERGIDPFAVAIEAAHDLGIEFHACYRIGWGGFYWPPPFDSYNVGGFYEDHQQLRCRRRDGTLDTGLSFAYPETRQLVVDLMVEMATKYALDGVSVLFNRQPPYVGYDPPLLEAFTARFGEEATEVPKDDPRWLEVKGEACTSLLREIRAAVTSAQGRETHLTAWTYGLREENLAYGLDVESWLDEGLVDTLIPYSSEPKGFSFRPAWEDDSAIQYWLDITKDKDCLLAPNLMPRDMSDSEHRRQALRLYRAGVRNLALWDAGDRPSMYSGAISRLGHREELEELEGTGEEGVQLPAVRLEEVADWRLEHLPE